MLYELKNLRKASGFTQASMAEKLGVPLGTYRNWEQGIYAPQDISLIKQIADILHVSMEALFGYDAFEPGALDEGLSDEEQFVYVPLYGRIAAGQPLYMDAVEDHILAPREIRRRHPNAFFLTVDGESMNNVLPNGCYALVDPEKRSPVVDGTAYAVCVNGYDATIKRIKQLENGVELIPDSKDPTFHAQVYDKTVEGTESITIIGEVVWYSIPFDFKI